MAFHSFQFVLGALPLLLAGFLVAFRIGGWPAAFRYLAVASLAFYAQFGFALLAILVISVTANYMAGELIRRLADRRHVASFVLLAAIIANVGALGYFKYSNFLIDIANGVFGAGFSHAKLLLPIGISFYTFIQIGYLIEMFAGRVERAGFANYVLFSTFFPCVTAGPLVMQAEVFGQLKDRRDSAFDAERIAVGVTLVSIGLFKKVVLADSIAPFADALFDGVGAGQGVTALTAWVGAIAYTLQLYFDFSGYSDMAIGLGCMFGLRLPLNFASPFKATSISEFWRRWHVTMTRFFTTYVYTPIAMKGMRWALGTRQGPLVRTIVAGGVPAIITFLVAGIWHGAGWTFVVYGLIHGTAIAVNLLWRDLGPFRIPAFAGWLLTMAVVISALVVFRAPDLATATTILGVMWSGGTSTVVNGFVALDMRMALALIVLLSAIVLLMPNSQQILSHYWVSSDPKPADAETEAGLLVWRPTLGPAVATACVSVAAIASIGATSTFLYYQF
ncbi:MAG: MBOAT family O-acyltransferase [Hyphomicrobiaceae bacterium]